MKVSSSRRSGRPPATYAFRAARCACGLRRRELRSGFDRRPLRHPGRCVAGVRPGDARPAAEDAQAARRAARPVHAALEPGRKGQPKNPSSPRDRAYDWRRPDKVLRGLRRYGLTPVLTLVGTPPWANSGRAPNFAPPRPRDFRRFATAAARRYPWVRYWLIWNEPNKRIWLRPTSASDLRPASAQPRVRGDPRRAAARPRRRRRDRASRAGRGASHPSPGFGAWAPPARSSTPTPTTRTRRRRPRRRPAAAARTAPASRWRRSGSS